MKSFLNGNILLPILCLTALSYLLSSCSDDPEPVNPTQGLVPVFDTYVPGAAARVEMWSTENLFAGYNELTLFVFDSVTGSPIKDAAINLRPVMTMMTMSHACPVEPVVSSKLNSYTSAVMFSMPGGESGSWTLHVDVTRSKEGLAGSQPIQVTVGAKTPSPIQIFKTTEDEKYVVSLRFPNGQRIGANLFDVVVYQVSGHDYVAVTDLTITIKPEMPSMDHGSPNNEDPLHVGGGHYRGKVNFTMSGDWRIHMDIHKEHHSIAAKYFDVVVN